MSFNLRHNMQLILVVLAWVTSAFLFGSAAGIVVLLTLFLFFRSGNIDDALLGFVVVLVLSDNLFPEMSFAKSFKNVYILLLAVYAILDLKQGSTIVKIHTYFIPFFLAAFIGILFSPVVDIAIQKLLSYFLLTIIVPYFIIRNLEQSGPGFIAKMVWICLLICIVGFLFNFINPEVSMSHGGRFRGIFGNPNGQGIFLIVLTLFFTVARSVFTDLFSKREVLLIYALILLFTFMTGSRTALLSILLFFGFSYLFKRSVFIGFIVFGIVILLTEYAIANFVQIIVSLGLEEEFRIETLTEGSGRLIAWQFAWEEIQRSIVLGRGMGYDEYYMRSNAEMLMEMGHEGGVHNTYLIIWLNTGLLGLVGFLGGLISLFAKASRNNHLAFPVMITVMFSITFEPWLASSLNPYTILLLSTLVLFFIHQPENYISTTEVNEETV